MSYKKDIYKICVYGTLRTHESNYRNIINRFGKDSYRQIGTTKLPGFLMYDLSYYPAIVRSDNLEDIITVELFDCSYDAYHSIRNMEDGAGYFEETVCIDDVFYSIFVMMDSSISMIRKLIDCGNWIDYIEDMNKLNY